jgi:hypothetical protein
MCGPINRQNRIVQLGERVLESHYLSRRWLLASIATAADHARAPEPQPPPAGSAFRLRRSIGVGNKLDNGRRGGRTAGIPEKRSVEFRSDRLTPKKKVWICLVLTQNTPLNSQGQQLHFR